MPHKSYLYIKILYNSYQKAGNNICLGLDPQWHKLPALYRKQLILPNQAPLPDCTALQDFLALSLQSLQEQGFSPAAFKPNLGYFQALDRPLLIESSYYEQYAFAGSQLLAWLYRYLSQNFSSIPIILDFKKGDIARSSANYAEEGFALWGSDAVTVSPYMGSDSIAPFGKDLHRYLAKKGWQQGNCSLSCQLPYGEGGVYSLLRTSNPGAHDLQDIQIDTEKKPIYLKLADILLNWRKQLQIPGLGAVVGATSLAELHQLVQIFSNQEFPLLIPGVGTQGAKFQEVCHSLQEQGYPVALARINLSSGLLQSWETEAPADWPKYISQRFAELL